MTEVLTMQACKRRLAIVWFAGSAVLFFLFLFQYIMAPEKFGSGSEAWGWLLPTFMPTLSLITGVFVMDIRGATDREQNVDRFLYRLALVLSVVYLFVVLLSIILHPYSKWMAIRFLNESNLWIAPLQGLVGGFLGAFFVKKER
ncbi:MAG: hypothetical protein R6U55_11470 [Desulfovermiculus sp.]